MTDIHNRQQRLTNIIQELEKNYNQHNLQLLLKFKKHLETQDLSQDRVLRYLSSFNTLGNSIGFALDQADKEQVKDLVADINQGRIERQDNTDKDYSPWTLAEFKKALKKFYKWQTGEEKPDIVDFVTVHVKQHKRKKLDPDTLLQPRHVKELVKRATNPRDKTLLFLMWETGARLEEILSLKWKDVKLKTGQEEISKIKFRKSKSQPRQVPVKESEPAIKNWKTSHPRPERKEHVFVNLNGSITQMKATNVYNIINKVEKKADIPDIKKTNPHHFRKSRATFLASQGWNAPQLCQFFGWSDFKTAKTYITLAKSDLEDAFKDMHGIGEQEEEEHEDLDPVRCGNCGKVHGVETNACDNCGSLVSPSREEWKEGRKEELETEVMGRIAEKALNGEIEEQEEDLEGFVGRQIEQAMENKH